MCCERVANVLRMCCERVANVLLMCSFRDQKEALSLIGLGQEGLLELVVGRAFARHAGQTLLRLLQQLLLYAVRPSHHIRSLLHYDRSLLTLN
jgi:hypothetical protein